MSRRMGYLGGLTALVGLGWMVWALVAAQGPREAVRQQQGVAFARVGDETLRLDLALPATGQGPFPAVVCIHGGGWVGGDRRQMAQTIDVLARRGHVGVAIDYRLAPKHRWPACIEDCKAAVRWLRANAGRYRIDPDRIGAVGLSAGGHLALLLGTTEAADGLEGTGGNAEKSSKVQAVVSFAGPTDLLAEALWTPEVMSRNLQPLFGGTPQERGDDYRKASPLHHTPRTLPPMLLVHGSSDKIVPVQQAHALAARVQQAGGKARVLVLDGEGHTWAGPALTRSIDQMLTFLDETLKK